MRLIAHSDRREPNKDTEGAGGPFKQTLRFAYRHSATLAAISVAWTLLSLPLITIGPATLGAYRAIVSLRETGQFTTAEIISTVRTNLLASVLFGLAPLIFGGIGVLYLLSPPELLGSFSLVLGTAASYLGLYIGLLLIPTYYRLASGDDPSDALRVGYLCIARVPRVALRLVIVTSVLFVVSALLTVMIVVVFPSFTMAYHIHVIEPELTTSNELASHD